MATPAPRTAPTLSTYTTSASVDFAKPSGLAVGDLLEVIFYLGAARTITPPDAGWQQTASALAFSGGAAGYQGYKFWKVADGTETSTLSFGLSASTDHTGAIVAITGVDSGTPFDATTVSAAGSSASIDAPTITTVTANALLLWLGLHWNGASGSETATSGFTLDFRTAGRGPIIQHATQATASASGAKSIATASTPWVVWMDALRPTTRVAGTVATSWAVRARVAKTSVTSWAVRSRVAKTSATSWSVRVRAIKTSVTSWTVRARLALTPATSWAVRVRVAVTRQSSWLVLSRATKTAGTQWAIRARVVTTPAASWSVRSRVGFVSATSWAVLSSLVVADYSKVRGAVGASRYSGRVSAASGGAVAPSRKAGRL